LFERERQGAILFMATSDHQQYQQKIAQERERERLLTQTADIEHPALHGSTPSFPHSEMALAATRTSAAATLLID
jgi:hypothetical protein